MTALALDRTRDALVVLFVAIGGALLLAAAPLAADRKPVKVTYIGDSVAAAMLSSEEALEAVTKGFAMRLDLRPCRRLVAVSCTLNGVDAPNVINTIRLHGRALGRVLVIQVGYNEDASGYAIDPVVQAARRRGVRQIVWVTILEHLPLYHRTNVAILRASRRWGMVTVADWNAFARGRPFFAADGVHLSPRGAVALARFVHPYIERAAARAH